MAHSGFCVICGDATIPAFAVHGYCIRRCATCAHEAVDIQPTADHVARIYDDTYFRGGGAGYPDYLAEGDLLRRHGCWYGRLLTKYTHPGMMLDVGTAAGFMLQGFRDCGWRGEGMEPNEGMARFGREMLGLAIDSTTCEEFSSPVHYDLVTMIQVVAHLIDVRKALAVCAQVLKANGLLLIETWDRRSWTARILGKHWHEYSPPSVLRWFSLVDLERLLAQFGFARIAKGRPPKRISGAHAKALLSYKLRDQPLAGMLHVITRTIPDSIEIPYPAEDLFWALFKKQ
jgi:SAM-dependent methyltransferase